MRALILLGIVIIAAPLAFAYVEGPLPGMTGGFGEPNCRVCHFDNPLNDPAGRLQVSVPSSYTPGMAYTITVALTRPDMRRGGFELASQFAAGSKAGRQAGEFRTLDKRVKLITSPDGTLLYAQHTQTGSLAATRGRLEWSLDWTAPAAADGPVIFHAAANATNDDASPLGDFVYLKDATSRKPK